MPSLRHELFSAWRADTHVTAGIEQIVLLCFEADHTEVAVSSIRRNVKNLMVEIRNGAVLIILSSRNCLSDLQFSILLLRMDLSLLILLVKTQKKFDRKDAHHKQQQERNRSQKHNLRIPQGLMLSLIIALVSSA